MGEGEIDAFSTAADMLRALRHGRVSSAELLAMHLRRIERYDAALNSVVVKDFERARRDADAADAKRARGEEAPLLGLPVTVKESVDVEGLPSTAGVSERRGHRAAADARTVARLRSAGAVVVGKTNVCVYLADFQADNPIYGRTNSPWDPKLTPGGSSGGSATLAAGLIPLDLGSDLGGSIRIPAAFCGLWGHKPSEGAVPNSGHFPGSELPNAAAALAVQGPHARSATDVELALDVISGPDVGIDSGWRLELRPARRQRLADFRVAVLPAQPWLPVDPEISAALEKLAVRLRDAGAIVRELQPPGLGDLRDYYRLFRSMMAVIVSIRWPSTLRERVVTEKLARGEEFHAADARGIQATAGDYIVWHEQRERYRAAYRDFFREWDVLLTPMSIVPAFAHTSVPNGDRRFTIAGRETEFEYLSFYPGMATLCGQPGTAFPAGFTSAGLPIGLQAIGPFLEDRTPLRFAQLLEKEFGGFTPPPRYDGELA
ncbi:MAG TPA: amidase [Tepidisphaeraceae bacterium]|jgi:amidase|nr:amidase [Tepidisphaeraceae bacterium]